MFFPDPRRQQTQYPTQTRRGANPYYGHQVQQPINFYRTPNQQRPYQTNFHSRPNQHFIGQQYPSYPQLQAQQKRPTFFRNEQGKIDFGKIGNGVSNIAGTIGQLSPIAKMIGGFIKK